MLFLTLFFHVTRVLAQTRYLERGPCKNKRVKSKDEADAAGAQDASKEESAEEEEDTDGDDLVVKPSTDATAKSDL